MSKQRRLTAWLRMREGEPPTKCGRQPQDTESDAEAMSDTSATLDSVSMSSSSNAPTGTRMSIWRYGAKMSATRIFLAPVTKKPAPEIRLGSAQPVNSVGKACQPYFTVYPACIIKK